MIDRLEKEVHMLERHFEVLEYVIAEHPTGIVNLSKDLGYPHHNMRYSLRMLENEALVEPTPRGAVPTEDVGEFVTAHTDHIDEIIATLEAVADFPTEN